uniref:PIN domain-containing protein n=1 Tax=Candidatus Kentrum sp. DK TaxID=2126562 RepID=A0A450SEW0_9GAMM|nr:MAG: hypothetical protein BECKDK2373B_GA0170837_102048 [Candidatus Kentron sp. DK]VFJ51268.1 MAG: hypothetical protein BECKDK2373C_GA0170839_103144 [Candidatus Kentron sp. DK]
MKPKVYIETSIVSYLAARSSRDSVAAANQKLTQQWWEVRSTYFEPVISEFVSREVAAGDADAAARRMGVIQSIPELTVTDEVGDLARVLIENVPLPPKAQVDAFHIAIAAIHGIEYLLTWNCTHIHNAALRPRIEALCRSRGFEPPIICTPQELLEA